MNLTKLILIGGVALVGAISSPVAQARDHDDRHRDRDHRDRYEYRHHHHRHYHTGYDRPYAYQSRRGVIQREAYYSRPAPRTSVTIAVGGHRHRR